MLGLGNSIPGSDFIQSASLLLDRSFAANPTVAYSLRKVSSSYSGNCVLVRRASDDAELNIGFSGGALDTSALATHCGSSDGFVVTWYDQSGNSNNATQGTAARQPKIYDGSGTRHITENGKPAITFDGSDDSLDSSSTVSLPLNNAIAIVAKGVATSTDEVFNIDMTSGVNVRIQSSKYKLLYTDLDQHQIADSTNNQFLFFGGRQSSSNKVHASINGGAQTSDTTLDSSSFNTTTGTLHVGSRNGNGLHFDGEIQEVIYYASDQLSNRSDIESEINTFYSIF
jgi:hypothetical protein